MDDSKELKNEKAITETILQQNDGADYANNLFKQPSFQQGEISENVDNLHRRLSGRQIQLIAIGGSIGTALFVSIGNGLAAGGPGSLFIAYSLYSCVLACVNNCTAEMITLFPVSGGFIRLAGKWVDDSLGFMAGWNFFLYEALNLPFEITAINLVLTYWRDDIPAAAVCAATIILYAAINAFVVRAYGEAEFWLSGGKVILLFILFSFTFITMVGGNPQHDAYGFRYWVHPGAFAENPLRTSGGDLARFEGFLACLWSAGFTIVGPEYIAMAAAETMRPRVYIKAAFKTVYWRFGLFFILGALCVGIVVPWNDSVLQGIVTGKAGGAGTVAASPYVIAMGNLGVDILPHVVNALLITSIFSAGNTYTYCATRSLYSLALEGRAPKILTRTTARGVPIAALLVVMAFPFLSFLQVSNSTSTVLKWITTLITGGALINFMVMCITYIMFHHACRVQGVDRGAFPYTGWFQPYCAWIGLITTSVICLCYGYTSFSPWNIEAFFQNYTMQIVAVVMFFGWKVVKGAKVVKADSVDLVWERPIVDAYEASFLGPPIGFWHEIIQLFRFNKGMRDERASSHS